MKVTTEITHDDLDDLIGDDEPDEPSAMVYACIGDHGGMRWAGAVNRVGVEQMTPEQYAEALVSAAFGAARCHGPQTGAALARWFRTPDELEVD